MLTRLIFLLWLPALAWAQESRGTVTGRVSDSTGAVVPGVKVRAVNTATGNGGASVTNHEGQYEIPYLIPGEYKVSAEMTGFKQSVRTGVKIDVDAREAVDLVLEPGDLSQSVVVTAEAAGVEAGATSLGVIIEDKQISELPVAGGNPMYLARLSAGTASTGGHSPGNPFDLGHGANTIIVNGTRTGGSEVSLDGAANMTGVTAAFSPMQDLVQEFKIQTMAFDAAYGHATGAQVNVSIKSGTNVLHGSSYIFDSFLRANPWFYNNWLYNPATGPVTQEKIRQAGGSGWLHQRWGDTAGGPLVIPRLYNGRNRTFWVFGFESMYVRRTPTFTGTVPTVKEKQGDFSDLLALGSRYQIYDPHSGVLGSNGIITRKPLAGNIVPANQIDPVARNILKYYPDPDAPGTIDGHNNFFRISDENKDYRAIMTRLDHAFSDRHRVWLRLNQSYYKDNVQTMPTIAVGDITDRRIWGVAFDDVYVISPSLLANLRYNITYVNPSTRRYSQGFDLATLGLPQSLIREIQTKDDPAGIAFPQITVTNLTSLSAGGGNQTVTYYQTFAGTLTKLVGAHSVRWGGEFRLLRESGSSYGNVAPNFDFSSNWTRGPNSNAGASPMGQEIAALVYGLPTGGQINVNASRAEQSTFTGLFVQDDWRLSRRLTLNFGLRYEYEGPTTERFNRSVRGFDFTVRNPLEARALANFAANPPDGIPAYTGVLGGVTFPGVGGQPRGLWTGDKNNFAPRAGLAWYAGRRLVVRAGYGIFFDTMGINRTDVNQGGFNQITPQVASLDNGLTFRAPLSNPFPDGIQVATGAGAGLLTNAGKGATFFYGDAVNPYMQRWTVSLQRDLGHRLVAEASYVGNRGTKLGANRQFDPIPRQYLSTSPVRDQPVIDFLGGTVSNPFYGLPEVLGTTLASQRVARSQLLRPYPEFTGITADIPTGFSYYHALQLQVQKRFSRGVSFQVAYTWSKFMEATSFLNGTDLRPEKVVSDQDYPQRLIVSGIAELPVGRGKRLLRNAPRLLDAIVGGWQVQGWYEGQSGQALGFGNAIYYGADIHTITLPVGERKVQHWFNPDAPFEKSSGRQLTNNLRIFPTRFNDTRGDGTNNLDGSLFKVFRVRERWRIQARIEAYNALNHPQFGNPNTSVTSTAFGTATGEKGHGQRQVTFAAKVMF